jgi:TP901 family phage tail tape measure protein
VRQFTREMDQAAAGGQLDAVADQAAGLGLGLAAAAGAAVKFAADFEKQMSAVSAATKASAQDMDRLREAALQAGKDTSFSATEAAQGIEELAKAGVSTAAVLGGGLRGALDLAAAGNLSVAEAAEIAASAMTQFKLGGGEVPHIADLLAAAAGKAQGSVHDMGMALSQAGLVASQMGLTVEDTTGVLASFASAGLMGSDAGTSLKTAMLMLANPTDKAAELMDDLGIQVYDASGQFVGITALAGQLRTQLGGLTQEQRNAALATIFGSDAIRAASVLYEQGADGIQAWIDKTNDTGYAADTAAKRLDNLAGDVERLKGSLQTLAIESASGPNQGLRTLTQTADAFVGELSSLPPAVGSTITVLAGLGGAALLLGAGWIRARQTTADMLTQLREVGPTGERTARGLETTTKWATRAAVAFVGLQVAGAIVSKVVGELNPQVEALGKGLADWGAGAELTGEAARILGQDFADLNTGLKFLADTDNDRRKFARWGQDLLETVVPGLDSTSTSLTKTRQRVTAIDQAFAGMVQGGNVEEARKAFERLAAEQAKNGVTTDELRKLFPQYAAALETAGVAAGSAAGGVTELGGASSDAAGATKEHRTELQKLTEELEAQTDPVFGLLNAQRNLKEAQDDAAEAVRKHGRNSAEARDATQRLAEAAVAMASKASALGDTFNGKLSPSMRTTLQAAGLTEAQISDVEREFGQAKKAGDKYTGAYKAHVDLTGYGDVMGKLDRMSVYQQALKKGIIPKGFQGPVRGPDGKYYAQGGWTGPGDMWQPAGVVHADEFVIRKSSRQRLEQRHPGLLDEMNATGQLPPGYARGGVVWPFPATVRGSWVPSQAEAASKVTPAFGAWPAGPGAQRGDSGVWRSVLALIRSTGPVSGAFGNAYRPGDPLWHGSGRAVDWMGYNQDALASFLAAKRPLELIHRTNRRDYAYTRGRNYGSFDQALMEAHRNHIHIAMAGGGVIQEPVFGVGASGNTYSFGENGPERVIPGTGTTGRASVTINVTLANHGAIGSQMELQTWLAASLDALNRQGRLPAAVG